MNVLVIGGTGFVSGAISRALSRRAFPRARMVGLSSGDVYKVYGALLGLEQAPPSGALDEEAPLRAVEYPYGRSAQTPWGLLRDYEKLHVERAVLGAGGTVLRVAKVYGPGDRHLERWLAALRLKKPIGVERAHWRWTHVFVEDVAQAVALVVESPARKRRVYNVGEAQTPTQLERFKLLARVAGRAAASRSSWSASRGV